MKSEKWLADNTIEAKTIASGWDAALLAD